jgi:hypothetical protein
MDEYSDYASSHRILMPHAATVTDSASLRQQLMAPNPMQRVVALHTLEVEAECGTADDRSAVAHAAAKFAARGIPFYAINDPHYKAWVGKAVDYWTRLKGNASYA